MWVWPGSTAKALGKIQPRDRFRILQAIDRLAVEPQAGGVLKGEFSGLRRLRVGSYRIIYGRSTTKRAWRW